MDIEQIKLRLGIIGNSPKLNHAIQIAQQVAGTDVTVLVTGESGVGKEFIPQIIHQNSPRKHGSYIAINCGSIPDGTIDSELFGHEKGAFTGAIESRRGYFEEADNGTIFLDEVGELPLSTQVRLLRVLQSGEFIRVGSSKVQKTDVRVIAATNVNLLNAISAGKFREDLYYRLNTVQINIPALRDRKEDIILLFRKFALDFADKYTIPCIRLDQEATDIIKNYRWPGNVRELKSVAERISILEQNRNITADVINKYMPDDIQDALPVKLSGSNPDYVSDRDIIFKILVNLKNEVEKLRDRVNELESTPKAPTSSLMVRPVEHEFPKVENIEQSIDNEEEKSENNDFSIQNNYDELIKKSLLKHGGKRKAAAAELGISERTLYRKLKKLGLE